MIDLYKEIESKLHLSPPSIELEDVDDLDPSELFYSFFSKLTDENFTIIQQRDHLYSFFSQNNYMDIVFNSVEMFTTIVDIFIPFLKTTSTEFTISFFMMILNLKSKYDLDAYGLHVLSINELSTFDYLLKNTDISESLDFYKEKLKNNYQANLILKHYLINNTQSYDINKSVQIIQQLLNIKPFLAQIINFIRKNSQLIIDNMVKNFEELSFIEIECLLDIFSNIPLAMIFNDLQISVLINNLHSWWVNRQTIFIEDILEEDHIIPNVQEKVFTILYQCHCINSKLITTEDIIDFVSTYAHFSDNEDRRYEEEEEEELCEYEAELCEYEAELCEYEAELCEYEEEELHEYEEDFSDEKYDE